MPAVLSYIYNIGPTSYHSFLGYREPGEGGGWRGGRRDGTISIKCKYTYREGEHAGCFYLILIIWDPPPTTLFLGIEILQETGRRGGRGGGRRDGTVSAQV